MRVLTGFLFLECGFPGLERPCTKKLESPNIGLVSRVLPGLAGFWVFWGVLGVLGGFGGSALFCEG